jgi:hypothetical protein
MATGPEHYLEAERLAERAGSLNPRNAEAREEMAVLASLALVHAQLAGAAATALNRPDGEGMVRDDYREWMRTASVKPPTSPGTSAV